ncbi:hypothetical protein KR044_006054 [Drosophila immigrans]|nr:hypothetical protein KR044_006054 [Drosophila immigrans]
MHVSRIYWIPSEIKASHRWRCRSEFTKLTAFGITLLLFAIYHQLSNWNGIVESEEHLKLRSVDDIRAYTKRFLEYGYNAWLSERLPLRRELPEVRDSRCLNIEYDHEPETVSIVVIFRNEQLATLLRMLHSLRDTTNMTLIGELIVINDYSDMGIWREELSRRAFTLYVKHYICSELQMFHMEDQMGLVRARRFATRESQCDNLVFVDANVEFTAGWLEPLLTALKEQQVSLVCPQLDEIDEQTLEYARVVERRGVFDWSLRRREVPLLWQQLKDLPRPFETPVPHTPVFAIHAEVFENMSEFDMQLNSPAAFELELSFKMWRANHRILQVPCSRVAHLQPSDRSYMRRYGNLQQMAAQQFSSYKRLVEIWLNDSKYKSIIYEYQPQIKNADLGNITDVQQAFNTAQLKSFDWYLQHVAPDLLHHFPLKPRTDLANGTLRPAHEPDKCLTGDLKSNHINLMPCDPLQRQTQHWTLSYMNDLRLGDYHCAEVQPNLQLALSPCTTLGGPQNWHLDMDYNNLVSNTLCLTVDPSFKLMVLACNSMNAHQMWYFEHLHLDAVKINHFN